METFLAIPTSLIGLIIVSSVILVILLIVCLIAKLIHFIVGKFHEWIDKQIDKSSTTNFYLERFISNRDKYTIYKGVIISIEDLLCTVDGIKKIRKNFKKMKLFDSDVEAMIYAKIEKKRRKSYLRHRIF